MTTTRLQAAEPIDAAELTRRIHPKCTTLKQVLRPEVDIATTPRQLAAACENARFLDYRLTDLEVMRVDRLRCGPSEAS